MSMLSFRNAAHRLGISLSRLTALAGTATTPTATTTDAGTVRRLAAEADVAVANATDLATAIALANANKAKINALLAKLRTAGILSP